MEYTVEDYSVLLGEDYGGEETFGEEFKILKSFLGVTDPKEILITTSEDGEKDHYDLICKFFHEILGGLTPIKSQEFDGGSLDLFQVEDFQIVRNTYPFEVIFIKTIDKGRFESFANKLKV